MYHINQLSKDLETEQNLLKQLAHLSDEQEIVEERLREVRNRISRNKQTTNQEYEQMCVSNVSN